MILTHLLVLNIHWKYGQFLSLSNQILFSVALKITAVSYHWHNFSGHFQSQQAEFATTLQYFSAMKLSYLSGIKESRVANIR
jgi:hypothetical protein